MGRSTPYSVRPMRRGAGRRRSATWSRYGQIQAAISLGSALAAALMLLNAQDPMSALLVTALSCISISAWRRRQGVLVEPFTTFSRIG